MRKKVSYDLFGKLSFCSLEREVEDAYNNGITLFFADSVIEHPYDCDGFVHEGLLLRLLIEYKYDEMLSNPVARARVLVQVLYYMKRFEDGGLPLPNVIMVGDKNECFVIHANDLLDYLDADVDWSIAPSSAGASNPDLVQVVSQDDNINPYIFQIKPGFDFSVVAARIRDLSVNVKRFVRVTEHNIAEIFDTFTSTVLRFPTRLTPHETVEVFLGVLMDPDEYYQHPRKSHVLVAKGKQYPIFGDAFIAFFDYFHKSYTPQEVMKFTEIADRLIEEVTRRRNGEFYTPVPFVDYSHKMLETHLGEDWTERFVVWDASCGTKNLTRDYRFGNLYCSTLLENDLNLSTRYNPGATCFVFDFLNGQLSDLPKGLKKALQDDVPMVWYQNPPYARAGRAITGEGQMGAVKGSAMTEMNKQMLQENMGACAANLYAQFIYRMLKIKQQFNLSHVHIGLFSPTLFFSGSTFSKLRKAFLSEFRLVDAIQFKASHFADVSESWGIAFTVWECGETSPKTEFDFNLIERGTDLTLHNTGKVKVYNLDNATSLGDWVRRNQCTGDQYNVPNLSSAIRVSASGRQKARVGYLGTILNSSNNVDQNATGVSIFSGVGHKGGNGIVFIGRENFEDACAFFAAKKLITCNWINSKAEYMAPNTNHPKYREFILDSVVFSLFHVSSQQSSLRGIPIDNNTVNIKNEFFFMSRDEMIDIANVNNNLDCYSDAWTDSERYVYEYLKGKSLSTEAAAVLNFAKSAVRDSFRYREMFDVEHPEYQINNWDCGWYQIKALLTPPQFLQFNSLFKSLCDKMRPLVYELGFLKQ